jgi:formate/nitrite transporter
MSVQAVSTFNPAPKVLQKIVNAGAGKAKIYPEKCFLLGIMAGAYIGIAGLLAVVVGGGLPGIGATDPGLKKLAMASVFPFGLMLVVCCGAELFTGDTMFLFAAILEKKCSWGQLAMNWVVSFMGNLVGSLIVAYFCAHLSGVLSKDPWNSFISGVADAKCNLDWGEAFMRGIGCNWLVCMALVFALHGDSLSDKMTAIWWPIMAFVAIGFEHSVANMFFIPTGLMEGGESSAGDFIAKNLIPVTLGNIIGGSGLTATILWLAHAPQFKDSFKREHMLPSMAPVDTQKADAGQGL